MLVCSGMIMLCRSGTIHISFYLILIDSKKIWFFDKRVLFNMSSGRISLVGREWISVLKLCRDRKTFFKNNWLWQCCDRNFVEGWKVKHFEVILLCSSDLESKQKPWDTSTFFPVLSNLLAHTVKFFFMNPHRTCKKCMLALGYLFQSWNYAWRELLRLFRGGSLVILGSRLNGHKSAASRCDSWFPG